MPFGSITGNQYTPGRRQRLANQMTHQPFQPLTPIENAYGKAREHMQGSLGRFSWEDVKNIGNFPPISDYPNVSPEQYAASGKELISTMFDTINPVAAALTTGRKLAGKIAPWEMTAKQYDAPVKLKGNDVFYVDAGGGKIEVVRNPTSNDFSSMKKEAIKKYGNPGNNDPALRFTEDAAGNQYYWKAHEAIHAHIEPELSRRVGTELNQNAANKPTHRAMVRRALYEGNNVPANVTDEYPGLLEEVRLIPGNKVK